MKLLLAFITIAFISCSRTQPTNQDPLAEMRPYMEMISAGELESSLYYLASDYFEGRGTGTPGQINAAYYLASTLKGLGVAPTQTDKKDPLENFFHSFPLGNETQDSSQNVIGVIEGTDPKLKEEFIILSAHFDHLGMDDQLQGNQIYNGAADDGSGTVALLEIAESLVSANVAGKGPRRSVIIALFSGEERGMLGSLTYTMENLSLLDQVVADINLDGVGGFDLQHPRESKNYIYLLQNDSTSKHLADKVKELNTAVGINLEVDTPLHPERFASDSRPFQYAMVPTVYFSTGLTEHYHKVTDEPATIDYLHMAKVTKLIFALTWDIGNSDMLHPPFNRAEYSFSGKFVCHPCGCSKDFNTLFDAPGKCPACGMGLYQKWEQITIKS